MSPYLRLLATTLVLGRLAAADTPPPMEVITAIDATAMTLTVQTSPSASDTATYTLTSTTVVQTADRSQGKLGDLVVGDHVAITLSGTTATEIDILPAPPLATNGQGAGAPGGGPSGLGVETPSPAPAGDAPAGAPRGMHR